MKANTKELMYQMYLNGDPIKTIAQRLEHSTAHVSRMITQQIVINQRLKRFKPGEDKSERITQIWQLLKEGRTQREVARMMNLHEVTIKYYFDKIINGEVIIRRDTGLGYKSESYYTEEELLNRPQTTATRFDAASGYLYDAHR